MENVEIRKIGPIAKGGHQNFALIERNILAKGVLGDCGLYNHILYYKYKGGAIYELAESISCCSDEIESILESYSTVS